MSDIIQYTTVEGQRWDNIAYLAYGRADMMNKLIEANPEVPLHDILPGGIVLNIPIVTRVQVKTDAELLPPWKR